MLRIISFLVITFIITSCNQLGMKKFTAQEITASSKRVNEILDRHFDEALARNPEFSSNLGYKTGYDKWTERTDDFYDNERNEMRKTLDSLKLFAAESLDDQTKLSVRLFEEELKNSEEDSVWRHHSYWITQMGGEHNDIPSFLINIHQIQNDTDAVAYISRLKGIENVFTQVTTQLKKRESIGVIPPAFTFSYVTDDLKNMIAGLDADGEKNLLLNDFSSKLDKIDLTAEKKAALKQEAKEVLKSSVKKAYQDFLAYWQTLSEKQKENNGAWSLPKGKEYYEYCLRRTTTTNMTADEIYETGLKEVARIQAEMREIMKKVNFKSDSLQEFFAYMRNDPKFKYSNDAKGKNDLLAESNSYIHTFKKVYLDKLFDNEPKAPLVVMEVEAFRAKSAGGAFYENPAEDGSRPGRFYVNTYNMNDEPRYQIEALCYHEATPGHHMQIALAQELRDVPKFRKYSGNTAYIEGWALYSELLPKEVGLYQDPYSDFGRLSMEIFRSARLVVDVGIHSKKWTKEQAIDYFIQNTANAPGDIKHEIERYFL